MKDKKLGTYNYDQWVYGRGGKKTEPRTLRVEVVGEFPNHYRVKYLGFHASGAKPGTFHTVRKDKVVLDAPEEPRKFAPRVTDIRLPYKDND